MSNLNALPRNSSSVVTNTIQVPTSGIELASPTVIKLIEQGGMAASLVLVCLFIWLLTRLIEAAKKE